MLSTSSSVNPSPPVLLALSLPSMRRCLFCSIGTPRSGCELPPDIRLTNENQANDYITAMTGYRIHMEYKKQELSSWIFTMCLLHHANIFINWLSIVIYSSLAFLFRIFVVVVVVVFVVVVVVDIVVAVVVILEFATLFISSKRQKKNSDRIISKPSNQNWTLDLKTHSTWIFQVYKSCLFSPEQKLPKSECSHIWKIQVSLKTHVAFVPTFLEYLSANLSQLPITSWILLFTFLQVSVFFHQSRKPNRHISEMIWANPYYFPYPNSGSQRLKLK